MTPVYAEYAAVFKAFCDGKRLKILELLRGGEKCACVLTEQLDMGQSTLSYHMKILVESGVVESRQAGKWTHYKISAKRQRLRRGVAKATDHPGHCHRRKRLL